MSSSSRVESICVKVIAARLARNADAGNLLAYRGAGGKNSDLTLNLVQVCQQTIGMETCMHLCCTEST